MLRYMMKTDHPVHSEPMRISTVVPDIMTDNYGNKYVVYNWTGAEIAKIEHPFSQLQGDDIDG